MVELQDDRRGQKSQAGVDVDSLESISLRTSPIIKSPCHKREPVPRGFPSLQYSM